MQIARHPSDGQQGVRAALFRSNGPNFWVFFEKEPYFWEGAVACIYTLSDTLYVYVCVAACCSVLQGVAVCCSVL